MLHHNFMQCVCTSLACQPSFCAGCYRLEIISLIDNALRERGLARETMFVLGIQAMDILSNYIL